MLTTPSKCQTRRSDGDRSASTAEQCGPRKPSRPVSRPSASGNRKFESTSLQPNWQPGALGFLRRPAIGLGAGAAHQHCPLTVAQAVSSEEWLDRLFVTYKWLFQTMAAAVRAWIPERATLLTGLAIAAIGGALRGVTSNAWQLYLTSIVMSSGIAIMQPMGWTIFLMQVASFRDGAIRAEACCKRESGRSRPTLALRAERNRAFLVQPRRAGKKIWGKV
jgi:hypothetical protein